MRESVSSWVAIGGGRDKGREGRGDQGCNSGREG